MCVGKWAELGWISPELLGKSCAMSDPADFDGAESEPEDVPASLYEKEPTSAAGLGQ